MQSQWVAGFSLASVLALGLLADGAAQEAPLPLSSAALVPVFTIRNRNGDLSAVGKPDGRITILRLTDGSTVRTLYHCSPRCAAFSPDGRLLATAGEANGRPSKVKVWSVANGEFLRQIETEVQPDTILIFSPNGEYLASTAPGFRVNVWEVATGRLKKSLYSRTKITRLIYSEGGEMIVAIQSDETARLFSVR